MTLYVRNEWRASQQVEEFQLSGNVHHSPDMPLEFTNDLVDFGFSRTTGGAEPLKACVRLTDPETYAELTNGTEELELPPDTTEKVWLSFSEFGYRDYEMTTPIGQCVYEVWLEGSDSVSVDVEVYV